MSDPGNPGPGPRRRGGGALPWLLAVGWMVLLWALSDRHTLGPAASLWGFPCGDKVVHGCAYGVLATLVHHAIRSTRPPLLSLGPVFFAFVFALLYGLMDEVHQAYVPGRDASALDLLADAVGAAIVCLALILWTDRPRGPSRVGDWFRSRRGDRRG